MMPLPTPVDSKDAGVRAGAFEGTLLALEDEMQRRMLDALTARDTMIIDVDAHEDRRAYNRITDDATSMVATQQAMVAARDAIKALRIHMTKWHNAQIKNLLREERKRNAQKVKV